MSAMCRWTSARALIFPVVVLTCAAGFACHGAAGAEISLKVLQGTQVREINLRSIDRLEYFRARPSY